MNKWTDFINQIWIGGLAGAVGALVTMPASGKPGEVVLTALVVGSVTAIVQGGLQFFVKHMEADVDKPKTSALGSQPEPSENYVKIETFSSEGQGQRGDPQRERS